MTMQREDPASCAIELLKICMLVLHNLENKLCFGVCTTVTIY